MYKPSLKKQHVYKLAIYIANNKYIYQSSCIKCDFYSHAFHKQNHRLHTLTTDILQRICIFLILRVLQRTIKSFISCKNKYYIC